MRIVVFILSIILLVSCNKDKVDIPVGLPNCLEDEFIEFSENSCSDATIEEYWFQGETVFAFDNGIVCCADCMTNIYNEKCTLIGTLGGITGNYDVNGENFSSSTHVSTIWSK